MGSTAALLPLLALPGATVPVLDERAWLDQLLAHRPALVMPHEGTMQDPAYWALVIKSRYRDELLASATAELRRRLSSAGAVHRKA